MSDERRRQIETYQAKLYRSTFAIHKELQDDLQRAVKLTGATSLSELLTVLARTPERAGEVLTPMVNDYHTEVTPKLAAKSMRAALRGLKAADLTPEEILAAVAAARAAKAGAAHDHE